MLVEYKYINDSYRPRKAFASTSTVLHRAASSDRQNPITNLPAQYSVSAELQDILGFTSGLAARKAGALILDASYAIQRAPRAPKQGQREEERGQSCALLRRQSRGIRPKRERTRIFNCSVPFHPFFRHPVLFPECGTRAPC
jgi:hypothetical protein